MPAPLKIPDTAQAPFRDDDSEVFNRIGYYRKPYRRRLGIQVKPMS
jgi:hypothetical protein